MGKGLDANFQGEIAIFFDCEKNIYQGAKGINLKGLRYLLS